MKLAAPVLVRSNNSRTKRTVSRLAVGAAILPASVGAGLVAPASPASAEGSWTQHVSYTDGDGLWVHSSAGLSRATVTTLLPEGAEIVTDCVSFSDVVGGTDPAWLHITSPTEGWVSDFYVDTSWDRNNTLVQQGLPECGGEPAPEDSPDDVVIENDLAPLDRGAAAQWALEHAQDAQLEQTVELWSGCTWFVSQALWAAGLPQTQAWNAEGGHSGLNRIPGTVAATAVDEFLPNLLAMYPSTSVVELGSDRFHGNAVPEAEVGDVIAYDWEGDGDPDHVSIVTSISDGDYPNVAEWGTNKTGHLTSGYDERGWTWSEKHHEWLQEESPGVTATLYHFAAAPTF
jgi:hypothetical protein